MARRVLCALTMGLVGCNLVVDLDGFTTGETSSVDTIMVSDGGAADGRVEKPASQSSTTEDAGCDGLHCGAIPGPIVCRSDADCPNGTTCKATPFGVAICAK